MFFLSTLKAPTMLIQADKKKDFLAYLQGGPLPIIDGVISPTSVVITSVTHL